MTVEFTDVLFSNCISFFNDHLLRRFHSVLPLEESVDDPRFLLVSHDCLSEQPSVKYQLPALSNGCTSRVCIDAVISPVHSFSLLQSSSVVVVPLHCRSRSRSNLSLVSLSSASTFSSLSSSISSKVYLRRSASDEVEMAASRSFKLSLTGALAILQALSVVLVSTEPSP